MRAASYAVYCDHAGSRSVIGWDGVEDVACGAQGTSRIGDAPVAAQPTAIREEQTRALNGHRARSAGIALSLLAKERSEVSFAQQVLFHPVR
jgi:hypothetical protein